MNKEVIKQLEVLDEHMSIKLNECGIIPQMNLVRALETKIQGVNSEIDELKSNNTDNDVDILIRISNLESAKKPIEDQIRVARDKLKLITDDNSRGIQDDFNKFGKESEALKGIYRYHMSEIRKKIEEIEIIFENYKKDVAEANEGIKKVHQKYYGYTLGGDSYSRLENTWLSYYTDMLVEQAIFGLKQEVKE